MGKNGDEGGHSRISSLRGYLPSSLRNSTSQHDSRTPVRNKVLAAVVATGAFVAVGQPFLAGSDESDNSGNSVQAVAAQKPLQAAVNGTPEAPASVELRGAQPPEGTAPQPGDLDKSQATDKKRAEAEQAKKDAEQAKKDLQRKEAQRKAVEEQIQLKKAFAEKAAEKAAAKKAAAEKAAAEKAAAEKAAAKKAAEKAAAEKAPAPAAKAAATPATLAEGGRLTSGYHTRGGSHAGIDIGADMGSPIYAPAGGEVISSGPASGFGKWVRIEHGGGKVTVYGHIQSSQVSVGQQVDAGQQIATVGSRGQSTGPHLHFEVRAGAGGQESNPIPWLKNQGITIE